MTATLKLIFLWGIVALIHKEGKCSKKLEILKFLTRGREAYDKLVVSVRGGANLGLEECRSQFQFSKWNCTIAFKKNHQTKHPIPAMTSIPHATRETAFAHGIRAAGITYSLTRDCRLGKFEDCSCIHNTKSTDKGNWWGGCNENIKFGEVMAKHFLEALEKGDNKNNLLNEHNNDVGRKAVRSTLKRQCRCHGITGSCSTLTCWRKLAAFEEVGNFLKSKYKKAKRVRFMKNKLKERSSNGYKEIGRKDHNLLFSEFSPDYCQRNTSVGASGVLGRVCEGTKKNLEQCRKMCSSCGLKSVNFTENKNVICHCKFEWCCKVKCETCRRAVVKTKCTRATSKPKAQPSKG